MAEYKLTEEGEEYLKNGLPEKNLVKLLSTLPQKSAKIGEIVNKVKNFPIALKWSLDKRWVEKKGNELKLIKIPEETEEEKCLKIFIKVKKLMRILIF